LLGGACRGLDLLAELVVVPEPGDDFGRALVGELVEYVPGRLDKDADVVPELVVVEQTLDHRLGTGVSGGQRRHGDES
jgi:hypothetical protein